MMKIVLSLAFLGPIIIADSCKKETVQPLALVSLEAYGIDLLTSPVGIPVMAPVLATFTTPIDPLTVTATSVWMIREYDHASVTLTMITTGGLLSIKPVSNLLPGTVYTVFITDDLKSTHGDPFGSVTATFTTAGRFVPEGEVAYWNFENSTDDVVGSYDAPKTGVVAISYVPSRNDSSGMAASFNGTTSLIEISNGTTLLRPEFTVSLWMYLNSDNHTDASGKQKGNYVFGIGNVHGLEFEVHPQYTWTRFSGGLLLEDHSTKTNDFQFSANGLTSGNVTSNPDSIIAGGIDNATVVNQTFGSTGIKLRLDKVWAHVVFTFKDSTRMRALYINGEKMIEQNLGLLANSNVNAELRPLATVTSLAFIPDLSIPARYDDKLTFGFWQSMESTFGGPTNTYSNPDAGHFQGLLDDVRMFNRALTEKEISLLYAGEKP